MGAGATAGLSQVDPATAYVRDGAAAINDLGDDLINFGKARWQARCQTTASSIANNAMSRCAVDVVILSELGSASVSTNGGFLVPATGRYKINGSMYFPTLAAAGNRRGMGLGVAGTPDVLFDDGQVLMAHATTASWYFNGMECIANLTAGQEVLLFAFQDTGAARTVSTVASARPTLTVERLS